MFHWREALTKLRCPNQQVNVLNEVLQTIFSNFIANELLTVRPRQAPWVTTSIKNFIRKNQAYRSFNKNGQVQERFEGIQRMVSEGNEVIEDAKQNYFMKIGLTLSNADIGQKTKWSLTNGVLNKAKVVHY